MSSKTETGAQVQAPTAADNGAQTDRAALKIESKYLHIILTDEKAATNTASTFCALQPHHFFGPLAAIIFMAVRVGVKLKSPPETVLADWINEGGSNPEFNRNALKAIPALRAAFKIENPLALADELAAKIIARWNEKNPSPQIEKKAKPSSETTASTKAAFEFGFTTDSDLDDRLGEIEWFWPGYIPRGFVTAAVGDQDVGKSQFVQSLCDIVIRSNRWPDGQPHEPRPDAKLLWIDTEGSIALLHQRMKQWGMKRGCFILPPDPLQELTVDDELHWMWIEAAIEKFQPPLVVIDALSGAHKSGKENGNDEMKPVMKKLAGLAQKYNIAVVVVHHLNKPIAGLATYPITIHRLRGASAIPQYCRSIIALSTPDINQPEKRRMDVIKLNLARKPDPVGYQLTDHGPTWGDAPEPPKERRAIDDALDFLEIALKDGPRLSEDVQEEAKAQKVGSNALRDAIKKMNVKARREGGKNGRWFLYPQEK